MKVDPAELILYEQLTPEKLFAEAERLGVSLEALKRDEQTYNRVFCSCLIEMRTEVAKAAAADLGHDLSDEQADSIARNSLVPDVIAEPVPLTPEERKLAAELYFHAVKSAAASQGAPVDDKQAWACAVRLRRAGERGATRLGKLLADSGCLLSTGLWLSTAAAGGYSLFRLFRT